MLRIAERLARKGGAQALVTGEVVGQVASQTLENMTAIARGDDARNPAAAGRHGQGRDHRRGAADRHLSDLDHSRSGLLHAVHAEASGDARAAGDGRAGRAGAADRGDGRRGGRGHRRGGLPLPDARISGRAQRDGSGRTSMTTFRIRERTVRTRPSSGAAFRRARSIASSGRRCSARTRRCAAPRASRCARWRRTAGIRPASIHDLYLAMGRGDAAGSPCRRSTCARWPTTPPAPSIRAAKKLNAGAFIFEIARSEIGYTEQRPHEYAAVVLGAALREGLHGPDLHPGRPRPDQRQEVQQPRPRQGARRAARADQGRDRRRLLQHRHRHLDAGRSRQADARRAAGGQRQPRGRLHRVHPRSTSRRASRSRSAARSARSAARTPTSTSCTPT